MWPFATLFGPSPSSASDEAKTTEPQKNQKLVLASSDEEASSSACQQQQGVRLLKLPEQAQAKPQVNDKENSLPLVASSSVGKNVPEGKEDRPWKRVKRTTTASSSETKIRCDDDKLLSIQNQEKLPSDSATEDKSLHLEKENAAPGLLLVDSKESSSDHDVNNESSLTDPKQQQQLEEEGAKASQNEDATFQQDKGLASSSSLSSSLLQEDAKKKSSVDATDVNIVETTPSSSLLRSKLLHAMAKAAYQNNHSVQPQQKQEENDETDLPLLRELIQTLLLQHACCNAATGTTLEALTALRQQFLRPGMEEDKGYTFMLQQAHAAGLEAALVGTLHIYSSATASNLLHDDDDSTVEVLELTLKLLCQVTFQPSDAVLTRLLELEILPVIFDCLSSLSSRHHSNLQDNCLRILHNVLHMGQSQAVVQMPYHGLELLLELLQNHHYHEDWKLAKHVCSIFYLLLAHDPTTTNMSIQQQLLALQAPAHVWHHVLQVYAFCNNKKKQHYQQVVWNARKAMDLLLALP